MTRHPSIGDPLRPGTNTGPRGVPTRSNALRPRYPEAGSMIEVNASASTSQCAPIASYAWNFGDGSQKTTHKPTTTHTYATSGLYSATLTVIDADGTSTQQVFTGQTMSLDGSQLATTTQCI